MVMTGKNFFMGDVLRVGWNGWKKQWGLLIFLVLLTFILPGIPHAFSYAISEDAYVAQGLLSLLGFFISLYVGLGMINVSLKIARGEEAKLEDFFNTFQYYLRYIGSTILFAIMFVIGFILFIIPGIVVLLKFLLFPYFIVDQNLGVIDALKASNRAVQGVKWDLLGFLFVAFVINLLGLLCLIIGLFLTAPLIGIAQAAIYYRCREKAAAIASGYPAVT